MKDPMMISKALYYGISLIIFIAAGGEMMLCLYRYIGTGDTKKCMKDACMFLVFLIAASYISADIKNGDVKNGLFFAAAFFAGVFGIIYAAAGLVSEYDKNKKRLSPLSIKQTLDDLDSGICYADKNGKIILINKTMGELISSVSGGFPQMAEDIYALLEGKTHDGKIEKIYDYPAIYRFGGLGIWRFVSTTLKDGAADGIIQLTAHEVSEIYEGNMRLIKSNEELKDINQKMQIMYDRLADRIREEETLDLKMRIHDEIGTSLIEISDILEGRSEEDTEKQIGILHNALSFFAGDASYEKGTFDDAVKKAAKMNVKLELFGAVPADDTAGKIIVAAARECVTNCIKHAEGDRVTVKITDHMGVCRVTVTNSGKPPEGKISEGGGLSALRRKIENSGGEMYISQNPGFTLIINIPLKKEI